MLFMHLICRRKRDGGWLQRADGYQIRLQFYMQNNFCDVILVLVFGVRCSMLTVRTIFTSKLLVLCWTCSRKCVRNVRGCPFHSQSVIGFHVKRKWFRTSCECLNLCCFWNFSKRDAKVSHVHRTSHAHIESTLSISRTAKFEVLDFRSVAILHCILQKLNAI